MSRASLLHTENSSLVVSSYDRLRFVVLRTPSRHGIVIGTGRCRVRSNMPQMTHPLFVKYIIVNSARPKRSYCKNLFYLAFTVIMGFRYLEYNLLPLRSLRKLGSRRQMAAPVYQST